MLYLFLVIFMIIRTAYFDLVQTVDAQNSKYGLNVRKPGDVDVQTKRKCWMNRSYIKDNYYTPHHDARYL